MILLGDIEILSELSESLMKSGLMDWLQCFGQELNAFKLRKENASVLSILMFF